MNHNLNNPQVSVIIPTYNRAHLIKRAIQSVLNQTYQNFEIIVVDDGSTDDTEEIVRDLNNKKIRYIRHNENKGAACARNTGIKVSRGEFIAFQDSDDEWFPDKLKRQMEVLKNAPLEVVGVVYTGAWLIKDNATTYRPFFATKQREGNIHKELFEGRITAMTAPVTIVRKECFNQVGMFDEHFSSLGDLELWLRISKYYEFKYIDEPLVNQYYAPDGISTDSNAYIKARTLILEKHLEEFKRNKKSLSKYFLATGLRLCSNGKTAQGIKYFLKSFKIFPLDIRPLLMILISLFGATLYAKAIKLYLVVKQKFKTQNG